MLSVCVCVCVCISIVILKNAGIFYLRINNDMVLGHINYCWLFNAKSIFVQKPVLFQIIQFNISTHFKCQNSSISNNSILHKYTV